MAVLPLLLDLLSFCRDSLPVTLVLEHLTVKGTFSESLCIQRGMLIVSDRRAMLRYAPAVVLCRGKAHL